MDREAKAHKYVPYLLFFYFTKQFPKNDEIHHLIISLLVLLMSLLQLLSSCWASSADLTHPLYWSRNYLFQHLDSIISFFLLLLLLFFPPNRVDAIRLLHGDVCCDLDIWTGDLWAAHRPVIREVCDNSDGIALYYWFSWVCSSDYIMGKKGRVFSFSMWSQVQLLGCDSLSVVHHGNFRRQWFYVPVWIVPWITQICPFKFCRSGKEQLVIRLCSFLV